MPSGGVDGYLLQNPAITLPIVKSKFLSQGLDPFGRQELGHMSSHR